MSDESRELRELREEARYWKRECMKARAVAKAARCRADEIARPSIEVQRGETWWRVLVNGERIDGYEIEAAAQATAERLRKAFVSK